MPDAYPDVCVCSMVKGVGMHVPETIVSNAHFASYLETSDEWIQDRTGIIERRWAAPNVGVSELAEPACREAIRQSGLAPSDIDGIIFATVTPDYIFPSSACFLQRRLGITNCLAFDVNAVCSGFVYALVTANSFIASGQCKNILVVGADIYSRIIDKNDRATCVLFGDGAGALVLSAAGGGGGNGGVHGSGSSIRGLYASELGADGTYTDILCVPSGTAAEPTSERIATGDTCLKMQGREVFKLAVRKLGEISENVLARTGFRMEQVDYFVSHQANKRILLSMARTLGVPEEKVLMNVEKYGNTSAASLPILLAEAQANGVLLPGHLVLLSAFGGGVTWGVVLLRW